MGVIRPAPAGASVPAGAMRLDDFARRGVLLREAAEREAERVLSAARAERDRLVTEGRARGVAEGRAEGHAKGLAEGREQGRLEALEEWRGRLAALESAWTVALEGFEAAREELLRVAREDLLRLATEIARRATHGAIDADPGRVAAASLEGVLREVGARSSLVVRANPDDAGALRALLPSLADRVASSAHAEIVEDAGLDRGSCVARTENGGELDASALVRVERIVEELLGGGEG